jgi:hypothetical protein
MISDWLVHGRCDDGLWGGCRGIGRSKLKLRAQFTRVGPAFLLRLDGGSPIIPVASQQGQAFPHDCMCMQHETKNNGALVAD